MNKSIKSAFIILLTNIANLFKVKSIITFVIIYTVSNLTNKGVDIPPEYAAFGGSIITYFFTRETK